MELDILKTFLPDNWESKCFELKAIERVREFDSPSMLLDCILSYASIANSLNLISATVSASGKSVSKVAVQKKFKKSWRWLKWIVEETMKSFGVIMQPPKWLGDKLVKLVDASKLTLKGSEGNDYRLHMMFDLFSYYFQTLDVTTTKIGEKLQLHTPEKGSILIGDRGYVSLQGIEHALSLECDFILRYKTRAFFLYDKSGKKLDLLQEIGTLSDWGHKSIKCFYQINEILKPITIHVMKKDEVAITLSNKHFKRNLTATQLEERSEEANELNNYIVLCTSLDYEAEKVFELYRCRWQIELIFKELKSTLSIGDIPSFNEDSVKTWFYSQLLIATISLLIVGQSDFPPKGKNNR